MKKNKTTTFDEFDSLDDYFEEEGDGILLSSSIETDYSNVGYEDFNKVNDSYEDEYEEIPVEKKSNHSFSLDSNFIDYLSIFWTWFRRIGIAIAILLSAYYITQGMFKDFFLYILLLVAAFFFGFGFMFFLNKYMEK